MTNRIRELREKKGWSQAELARRVKPKTSQAQIDRLEKGQRRLDLEWMSRIATALDAQPRDLIDSSENMTKTGQIMVRGAVETDAWSATPLWPEEKHYPVSVPEDDLFEGIERFGIEVRGNSANARYPEGTLLECIDVTKLPQPLKIGKRYLVQCVREDGKFELTVRLLEADEQGNYFLTTETLNPALRKTIPYQPKSPVLQIIARVVKSHIPE